MPTIRPLKREDIAQLAPLREQCFGITHHRGEELEAYFARVFFDNPWADGEIVSQVCEDDSGGVVGFVGALPRAFRFRGKRVKASVFTQFMVAPQARGQRIGQRLVERFLDGPQDFSLTDVSNEATRRIWLGAGGDELLLHSMQWTRLLRPSPLLESNLGQGRAAQAIVGALRPLLALGDVVAGMMPLSPFRHRQTGLQSEELSVDGLLEQIDTLPGNFAVAPDYDRHSLSWVLDFLGAARDTKLIMRGLRDANDSIAGWYCYLLKPGGISEVVHFMANGDSGDRVVGQLIADAWADGAGSLRAQLLPRLAANLSGVGRLRRQGPWTMVHSRDRELQRALLTGDGFLSRLEGEWWLGF